MGITEQEIHLFAEVERSVEDCYHHFTYLAHGFEHVQRVYHLALSLSEQEQADGVIVGMAALLHDLGRTTPGPTRSHAVRSVKRAKQFLASHDLSQERQQAILHAILAHSYRHGTRTATLEARALYDAHRFSAPLPAGTSARTDDRRIWL
jgi:uncharacterized protein